MKTEKQIRKEVIEEIAEMVNEGIKSLVDMKESGILRPDIVEARINTRRTILNQLTSMKSNL